jgi:membrane protease YdiL (CAAX protease family)
MNRRRFLSWRPDLVLTVTGLLGIVLFLAFYDRALPSAALDLTLSREQIAEQATAYMSRRGYALGAYQTALTFEEDDFPSVYLQRTLGILRTNELAQQENLPLWLWKMRWFQPLQKEEFGLSLLPDGTVVGMSHTLLEDAPGADLPQTEAQALAEIYLAADRGWNLAGWELVTASTESQPGGRADHHFEWRRLDWNVGDSELRLAVDVQGNQVDGYDHRLEVPEAFQRQFNEQHNRADFIANLAYYLSVGGFGLVLAIFFFLGHRRGIFPWHEGLLAGLVVGAVYLLYALNVLPLGKAYYDTTLDYPAFWIYRLINILTSTALVTAEVTLLWGGGRYLARRLWPRRDMLLPRSDDRWLALSRSTWRGLMVGGLWAGYAVVFYLITTQLLGGWIPMGRPDVNLYATPLPFSAALTMGVIPAVTEEFLARLAGIGFLLLVLRRRWLAVLVPGVLWAFAHLSYVRDPLYLRGVELTAVALFTGYLFLRFGLATTIVAHLAYNAGLTALPLLRSGQPSLVANGGLVVAVLLAPTIPGAVRWLRRRLARLPAKDQPSIRPATEDDLARLAQLMPGEDWSAHLADPSAVVLYLGTGEEPAGAAVGQVQADGQARATTLFIAPEWRRRYWGSCLVQALDDALWAKGARSPQVTLPAGDWAQARFWDAQGWSAATVSFSHIVQEHGGELAEGRNPWTRICRKRASASWPGRGTRRTLGHPRALRTTPARLTRGTEPFICPFAASVRRPCGFSKAGQPPVPVFHTIELAQVCKLGSSLTRWLDPSSLALLAHS